jgi:hypothetical protein
MADGLPDDYRPSPLAGEAYVTYMPGDPLNRVNTMGMEGN